MNRLILITLFVCTSLPVFSGEKVLLTIYRKDNGRVNRLFLRTDDQNLLKDVYIDLKGPIKRYDANKIRKGTGIYFQKGMAVISLKSSDLDESFGGNIQLIYLREYNIVGENVYKSIPIKILKDENGEWALFKNGKKVTKAHAYPYTWGIKKLVLQ